MCSTKSNQQIVDDLKASPMFNMSLSSKELFHSNFLAWLGNNPDTKEFFTAVINDLVNGLNLSSSGTWTVEREDKHFDLCIIDKNNKKDKYLLIIENKVKSIPIKRQLDEYVQKKVNGKDQHTIYLLLSLTEKFAHRTKIDKKHNTSNDWFVKSYWNLADAMRNNKQRIKSNHYIQSLLDDYIDFIENLHLLVQDWQNEPNFAQKWEDIYKLQDLHAKIQFSRYCEKLKQVYLSKLPSIEVYDDDSIPDPKDVDANKIYVKVTWGYASRGQEGILDIEIPVTCLNNPKIVKGFNIKECKYSIKIQVQGRDYRHVIETNTNNATTPVGHDLKNIGKGSPYTDPDPGFDFFLEDPSKKNLHIPNFGNNSIFVTELKQLFYPVRTTIKYWPFASYDNSFMYQSRRIKEQTSIEDVLENIAAEVERIVKFLSKRPTP